MFSDERPDLCCLANFCGLCNFSFISGLCLCKDKLIELLVFSFLASSFLVQKASSSYLIYFSYLFISFSTYRFDLIGTAGIRGISKNFLSLVDLAYLSLLLVFTNLLGPFNSLLATFVFYKSSQISSPVYLTTCADVLD